MQRLARQASSQQPPLQQPTSSSTTAAVPQRNVVSRRHLDNLRDAKQACIELLRAQNLPRSDRTAVRAQLHNIERQLQAAALVTTWARRQQLTRPATAGIRKPAAKARSSSAKAICSAAAPRPDRRGGRQVRERQVFARLRTAQPIPPEAPPGHSSPGEPLAKKKKRAPTCSLECVLPPELFRVPEVTLTTTKTSFMAPSPCPKPSANTTKPREKVRLPSPSKVAPGSARSPSPIAPAATPEQRRADKAKTEQALQILRLLESQPAVDTPPPSGIVLHPRPPPLNVCPRPRPPLSPSNTDKVRAPTISFSKAVRSIPSAPLPPLPPPLAAHRDPTDYSKEPPQGLLDSRVRFPQKIRGTAAAALCKLSLPPANKPWD